MQILFQSPSYHLTKPCCPLGSLTTQPVLSYQRIWAERHLHRETVCTTTQHSHPVTQKQLFLRENSILLLHWSFVPPPDCLSRSEWSQLSLSTEQVPCSGSPTNSTEGMEELSPSAQGTLASSTKNGGRDCEAGNKGHQRS